MLSKVTSGWLMHGVFLIRHPLPVFGEGRIVENLNKKTLNILLMNTGLHFLHLLYFSVIYQPNFNSAELLAKELYRVFRKCWILSEVNYQLAGSLNVAGFIVSIKIN